MPRLTLLDPVLRRAGYVPAPPPRPPHAVGAPPPGHSPNPNYQWKNLAGSVIYAINADGDPREASSTNPLPVAAPDLAASGALGALHAIVSVPLAGHQTAGFHLAAGTLAATLTPVVSYDGGATWVATAFHDPASGTYSSTLVLTNPNAAQNYGIRVGGGVTHVGVQVSAYTSGTATATVTATAAASNQPRGQMTGANSVSVVPASNNSTQLANPAALVTHRPGLTSADGTTKPTAANSSWAANPGNLTRCRVYVDTTGSPTTCTIRGYLRSATTDGSNKHVGTTPVQTLNSTPNYDLCYDLQPNGADVLVFVESLSGGSSPTVTIYLEWS